MHHNHGINLVFVETLYNGYSAFRTSIADFPYNPRLDYNYADGDKNYADYLTAFAAACNKYGNTGVSATQEIAGLVIQSVKEGLLHRLFDVVNDLVVLRQNWNCKIGRASCRERV